jgi:hypothetical protein
MFKKQFNGILESKIFAELFSFLKTVHRSQSMSEIFFENLQPLKSENILFGPAASTHICFVGKLTKSTSICQPSLRHGLLDLGVVDRMDLFTHKQCQPRA